MTFELAKGSTGGQFGVRCKCMRVDPSKILCTMYNI